MKFVKLEDVEKILGDIYESMGSSRHNWCDPLRKNDVEEWWWSDDKNNDFVEHAHWKWKLADNGWADTICSNCGHVWNMDVHVSLDYDYCPYCGAKMDEEVE